MGPPRRQPPSAPTRNSLWSIHCAIWFTVNGSQHIPFAAARDGCAISTRACANDTRPMYILQSCRLDLKWGQLDFKRDQFGLQARSSESNWVSNEINWVSHEIKCGQLKPNWSHWISCETQNDLIWNPIALTWSRLKPKWISLEIWTPSLEIQFGLIWNTIDLIGSQLKSNWSQLKPNGPHLQPNGSQLESNLVSSDLVWSPNWSRLIAFAIPLISV